MAGRSMFEHCLATDIVASLRGRTNSWNEESAGHSLARLSIEVFPSNRANRSGFSADEYWISGDRMSGSLSVESIKPIAIIGARISLEGVCRTHTMVYDPDAQIDTISKLFAYKFLSQVHQLESGDFRNAATNGSSTTTASAPFDFLISSTVLTKATNVPQQCLQLPPSMTVGTVLQDESSGQSYAQPRISYSLVANVEIQSGDGHRMTISSSKEIPIWSFSAPQPPVETRDFPAEFVEKLYHPGRPNRFRKETFLVTVSSSEPSSIMLVNRCTPGIASCEVLVTVADTHWGFDVQRLLEVSPKIRLSIVPALRIKTFYSIIPFSRVPGQTMLTTNGPMRLHDELRTLQSVSYSNLTWHSSGVDDHNHVTGGLSVGAAISATVSMVLQTPPGLSPSFCSAVAARQYSLTMQCKVKGVHVNSFGLEVPLQILYDPSTSHQILDNAVLGTPTIAGSVENSSQPPSAAECRLMPPDYGP